MLLIAAGLKLEARILAGPSVRVVAGGGDAARLERELDAAAGEALILLNHVSHDVDGPYRAAHAILVRENAQDVAPLVDRTPPVFERRTLSLRAFDGQGDLVASRVAGPGEHDGAIRDLLSDPRVDHIDAHNAGHGCFSARIERYMEAA